MHYFQNGKIQMKGQFLNGVPSGRWTMYHSGGTGDTAMTFGFVGGLLDGSATLKGYNGSNTRQGYFKHGKMSWWKEYFTPSPNLAKQGVRTNDSTEAWTFYNRDAEVVSTGIYTEGAIRNSWKTYSPKGNIKMALYFNQSYSPRPGLADFGSHFVDSLFPGYLADERTDDNLFPVESWHFTGTYERYDSSGSLVMSGGYTNGRRAGIWKRHENGEIRTIDFNSNRVSNRALAGFIAVKYSDYNENPDELTLLTVSQLPVPDWDIQVGYALQDTSFMSGIAIVTVGAEVRKAVQISQGLAPLLARKIAAIRNVQLTKKEVEKIVQDYFTFDDYRNDWMEDENGEKVKVIMGGKTEMPTSKE